MTIKHAPNMAFIKTMMSKGAVVVKRVDVMLRP